MAAIPPWDIHKSYNFGGDDLTFKLMDEDNYNAISRKPTTNGIYKVKYKLKQNNQQNWLLGVIKPKDESSSKREYAILQKLKGIDNIINIIGIDIDYRAIFIVPYIEMGFTDYSKKYHLKMGNKVERIKCEKSITFKLCKAASKMHALDIVHAHICPTNIRIKYVKTEKDDDEKEEIVIEPYIIDFNIGFCTNDKSNKDCKRDKFFDYAYQQHYQGFYQDISKASEDKLQELEDKSVGYNYHPFFQLIKELEGKSQKQDVLGLGLSLLTQLHGVEIGALRDQLENNNVDWEESFGGYNEKENAINWFKLCTKTNKSERATSKELLNHDWFKQ